MEAGTGGPPAGARPAFGEGPPPKHEDDRTTRDLTPLASVVHPMELLRMSAEWRADGDGGH